jgi:hypothetical protein
MTFHGRESGPKRLCIKTSHFLARVHIFEVEHALSRMNRKWIFILPAVFLFACRKEHTNPIPSLPPANGIPVNVTIDQTQKGYAISPNFLGLSFETAILTENPNFLNVNNTTLIQLIKNLGPGILRIGGDSSDETFWAGNGHSGSTDSLTTTDIDRLSGFANAIGWPVLFGLNLGNDDAYAAADEAKYVHNSLGPNLYAMQSGNEPDVYRMFGLRDPAYTFNNYQDDWETYRYVIESATPGTPFAGPDIAYNTDWITYFANAESNNVKLMDAHYYVSGPATDPNITYQSILWPSLKLNNVLQVLKTESSTYHLPYRITEVNSIYGGGKAGVSDVFASALWALDFMWTVAENGGQGINFHGGDNLVYSPVYVNKYGVLTTMPEYYAMLAFKYGASGGTIIPASIETTYNCSVYACAHPDNSWSVTLINKDAANNFSFTIPLSQKSATVQVARLKAPSLTTAAGTTFGGGTVNADGTFKPSVAEQYLVTQTSFVINVPAGSAAVVTAQ